MQDKMYFRALVYYAEPYYQMGPLNSYFCAIGFGYKNLRLVPFSSSMYKLVVFAMFSVMKF